MSADFELREDQFLNLLTLLNTLCDDMGEFPFSPVLPHYLAEIMRRCINFQSFDLSIAEIALIELDQLFGKISEHDLSKTRIESTFDNLKETLRFLISTQNLADLDFDHLVQSAKVHTMTLIRACYPCTLKQIEFELVDQCIGVTVNNAATIAILALSELLKENQIEQYEILSYSVRTESPSWTLKE